MIQLHHRERPPSTLKTHLKWLHVEPLDKRLPQIWVPWHPASRQQISNPTYQLNGSLIPRKSRKSYHRIKRSYPQVMAIRRWVKFKKMRLLPKKRCQRCLHCLREPQITIYWVSVWAGLSLLYFLSHPHAHKHTSRPINLYHRRRHLHRSLMRRWTRAQNP